jgi:hypothetical protein
LKRLEDALAASAPGRLLGYAFGTRNRDLTVFDVVGRRPLGTVALGATVRWLSNEQTFWDGKYIWTYDFPDNAVRAIAIDPLRPRVAHSIPAGGKGPAHSLMLTKDRKAAWINLAGSNELAIVDVQAGKVSGRVATGEFP